MTLILSLGWSHASVIDDIGAIEDQTSIAEDNLYLVGYYRQLLEDIEGVCPGADIALAKKYIGIITEGLSDDYNQLSSTQQLQRTIGLYDRLAAIQRTLPARVGVDDYCAVSYTLYGVQSWLRDSHMKVIQASWILNDFGTLAATGTIYAYDIKLEILDTWIAELQPYASKLGHSIDFNEDRLKGLDDKYEAIGTKSEALMKLMVYKTFSELIERGLFTLDDVKELDDKITLYREQSCSSFHGNYQIRQTTDSKGNHIRYDTIEMPLVINVCGNYFGINSLYEHFEELITHELGHHFYYYYDREGRSDFEDICRSDEDTQNGQCNESGFVSDYAQTLAPEDYAEHFTHRFLDTIPATNTTILRKSAHFNKFLP
jgi:hypothetical protein